MANYIVTDTELIATADALREKLDSNSNIQWKSNTGFADDIEDIAAAASAYAVISIHYPAGSTCTCSKSGVDLTAEDTSGHYNFLVPEAGTYTLYCADGTTNATTTVSITTQFQMEETALAYVLNDTPWNTISIIAQRGIGDTYWDIGDCKQIVLNGNIGAGLTLSNFTTYVFILDFNHPTNKTIADNNIIFGGFKTALNNGIDIALCDSKYGNSATSGKYFNINHKQVDTTVYNTNYGGWKGCDFRYDILGATETKPNPYNAVKTTSTVGYDATTTAITSPVANTLMAALPSDFRNVLRLHTHYVDNKGNSSNVDANVTNVVDAGVFLLAECEIFSNRDRANSYEQNHQKQMAYYKNGNSKIKYKHEQTNSYAYWWESSAYYNDAYSFSRIIMTTSLGGTIVGDSDDQRSNYSSGLAPAFKV